MASFEIVNCRQIIERMWISHTAALQEDLTQEADAKSWFTKASCSQVIKEKKKVIVEKHRDAATDMLQQSVKHHRGIKQMYTLHWCNPQRMYLEVQYQSRDTVSCYGVTKVPSTTTITQIIKGEKTLMQVTYVQLPTHNCIQRGHLGTISSGLCAQK